MFLRLFQHMKIIIPAPIIVIALFAVQRATLIGDGAMAFWDESRYFVAIHAFEHLFSGNFEEFVRYAVGGTLGRPGAVLLWALPIALQQLLIYGFNISVYEPIGLIPAQVLNVLVSIALLIAIYCLTLRYLRTAWAQIGVLVAFAMLTSSSLYVRHLVPYDAALLCFTLALLLIANWHSKIPHKLTIAGLLTGFGFTIYPGYYFFVAIVSLQALSTVWKQPRELRSKLVLMFSGGLISVLLFWEALSIAGVSYAAVLKNLSHTIKGGTYSEGFIFLPEYLLLVEGPIGAVVLVVVLASFFWTVLKLVSGLIKRVETQLPREMTILLISTVLAWFWHAYSSVFLLDMVFYGRIVHGFTIPLLLCTAGYLELVSRSLLLRQALIVCAALAVVWWFKWIALFMQISYPRDALYQFKLAAVGKSYRLSEMDVCNHYTSSNLYTPELGEVVLYDGYSKSLPVLLNFCDFYPVQDTAADFSHVPGMQEVYRRAHFAQFRAYLYEGLERQDRDKILRRAPVVRVFSPDNVKAIAH